jgi:predicted alpha/beta hydrolase family esterase
MVDQARSGSTVCLTVPGLGCSGAGHWQTIWETERNDCRRIDLGCWDAPLRSAWVSRIEQAVTAAKPPVVLVAHSLGCHAVAWWARWAGEDASETVRGALLVAPPDVDHPGIDRRLAGFAPAPRAPLPFPSILVASSNDPYATIERSAEMAAGWLSSFVAAGELGHLNADSGLGAWREGQALLARLIGSPVADQSCRSPLAAQTLAGHATLSF